MSIQTKLKNLESKAKSKGEFALCAAAAYLSRDFFDTDARINLLGALHECWYLQNSLKPYRTELGADSSEWMQRCLQRLVSGGRDYWALAALLCGEGEKCVQTALNSGYQRLANWSYDHFKLGRVNVVTLYRQAIDSVLSGILEIGYAAKSGECVDVGRSRALSIDRHDSKFIKGILHLTMQAKLPYGAWRTESAKFYIDKTSAKQD